MHTSAPLSCKASPIRSSSVATTTCAAPASRARCTARAINGCPPRSRSGLPGKRVEAWRAGMATMNGGVPAAMGTSEKALSDTGQCETAGIGLVDETGKRRRHIGAITDVYRTTGHQPRRRHAHGDAMIAVAVDDAATERPADDACTIGRFVDRDAQRAQ